MIENIRFTRRAIELIKWAEIIKKENNFNFVHPVHLFFGAMKIESKANSELRIIASVDIKKLEQNLNTYVVEKSTDEYLQIKIEDLGNINITSLTKEVLLEAKRTTELYEEHGQIFVNDGQILRAVFNSNDHVTKRCLEGLDKDLILQIIASPRDMVVDLKNDFSIEHVDDVIIKKVTEDDKASVREFVLKNFYERWTKTIDYGLQFDDIPVYIALVNNNIVGFAGYNISKQRSGYFGPLGVLRTYRDRKIGQTLLNACLIDMKRLGLKTCIIGNASSIEFYEKACGAMLMPIINI